MYWCKFKKMVYAKKKFHHHLLKSFQSCINFFFLLNKIKYFEECWKTVAIGIHSRKRNTLEVKGYTFSTLIKISSFVFIIIVIIKNRSKQVK